MSRNELFVQQVMRSTLEPLIDKLFEEDELFMQDFEDDGLSRVLFIRKMGIYVEVSYKLSLYHNERIPLPTHCRQRTTTSR